MRILNRVNGNLILNSIGTSAQPLVLESSVIAASVEGTGSLTINKPAGVTVGDMLVIIATFRPGDNTLFTEPSGWTVTRDASDIDIMYKRADGSEPASYTFNLGSSLDDCVALYARFSGAADIPIGVSARSQAVTKAMDAPSITVSANAISLYVFNVHGGGGSTVGGDNDSFIILGQAASGGTGENRAQFGYKQFPDGGATQVVNASNSLGNVYGWSAMQIEIIQA